MKLRQPWLIKTAGLVGAHVGRLWMNTLRFRYRNLGPDVRPQHAGTARGYLYAIWHEDCLVPPFLFAGKSVHVLVSRHADGALIGEVLRHLHIPLIRGSSTRGGAGAVLGVLNNRRLRHLAVTPDGPRGPRRVFQAGLVYLASRTGRAIVPCGLGYGGCWRLPTWDRLAVPRPWSPVTCVSGVPISVPPDAGRVELEACRRRVEQAMASVAAVAEQWAQTGRWPPRRTPATFSAASDLGEKRQAG